MYSVAIIDSISPSCFYDLYILICTDVIIVIELHQ
jgi:hypothetical protein